MSLRPAKERSKSNDAPRPSQKGRSDGRKTPPTKAPGKEDVSSSDEAAEPEVAEQQRKKVKRKVSDATEKLRKPAVEKDTKLVREKKRRLRTDASKSREPRKSSRTQAQRDSPVPGEAAPRKRRAANALTAACDDNKVTPAPGLAPRAAALVRRRSPEAEKRPKVEAKPQAEKKEARGAQDLLRSVLQANARQPHRPRHSAASASKEDSEPGESSPTEVRRPVATLRPSRPPPSAAGIRGMITTALDRKSRRV